RPGRTGSGSSSNRLLDSVEVELLERRAEWPVRDDLEAAGNHRLEHPRLPFLSTGNPKVHARVAAVLDLDNPGDRGERLEVLRRRRTEEGRLECRRVRAAGEVTDGAVDQELSVVQERDIVAHLLDLAEEVGAHEDRPALARQRLDDIADLRHAPRIQARSGPVEDELFGPVEERL